MKLVSIIIPVYNAESDISRCLDSILSQTISNFEVLCIDDGSKDSSFSILQEYEKKDKRIHAYRQRNMGVAKTRNKGIQLSHGEYIAFIDNDDYIEEDYLEKYYTKMINGDFDIVIGGYKRVLDGKVIFKEFPHSNVWSKYVIVTPWAKLFKKDVILKYNAQFLDYGIAEDIFFLLNLYSHNLNIGYLNYMGYCWYFNRGSVSNTSQRGLNDSIDILYVTNEFLKYRENNHEIRYLDYFIYRYCIWYLLFSGGKASSDVFFHEYKRIFSWLKENRLDHVRIVKEEYFKYKVIIFIMKLVIRFKLVKVFSKIYCHGTH